MPNGYGAPIGVEIACKVAATAIAEGSKNAWNVAVAVVERRANGAPRGDAHRRAAGREARGYRLVTARDRSQQKSASRLSIRRRADRRSDTPT